MHFTLHLCVAVSILAAVAAIEYVVPPSEAESAPYAEWAHDHWVWLPAPESNQKNCTRFFNEWMDHDIPVGNLHIDSTWATGINSFVFDPKKFPNPQQMINYFHAAGSKVTLWATSMIDTDSPNFQYANESGYFIRNAFNGSSTLHWWHGDGELLDYTNPAAREWWHSLLDNILDLGVDGWKTDGTDPFIMEYLEPQSHAGPITYREYADLYYGDFLNYTRKRNGDHCLIMSRPVDSYPLIGEELSAYLPFSPHYVMFSGWVGDQDPTFEGIRFALRNMIHSAWRNYTNFGSDIGGYRKGGPGKLGRTTELFTRWFQLGAFVPLMENGGENEHRPWKFDEEGSTTVVDMYRRFTQAHMELRDYLLATGAASYAKGISSMRPTTAAPAELFILQSNADLVDYSYKLGDDIFVYPITETNTTVVKIKFPNTTNGERWVNYFNHSQTFGSGETAYVATPLEYFPVYKRAGSIIPMSVASDASAMHPLSRLAARARSDPRIAESVPLPLFPLHKSLPYSTLGFDDEVIPLTLAVTHPAPSSSKEASFRRFQQVGVDASYAAYDDRMTFSVSAVPDAIMIHVENVRPSETSQVLITISDSSLRGAFKQTPLTRGECPDTVESLQRLQELVKTGHGVWYSCAPDATLLSPWEGSAVGNVHEIVVIPGSSEMGLDLSLTDVQFLS